MSFKIETNTYWPVLIPLATESSDGLMSAADKAKLDSLSPGNNNSGFAQFTDGGSGEGHDFVTVSLTTPFLPSQIPYIVSLAVIRTDGGPIPTVGVTSQTETEMVISTTALGNFKVAWSTSLPP